MAGKNTSVDEDEDHMSEFCFKIGNSLIERCIYLENGVPVRSVVRNLTTGTIWETDGREAVISLPGINLEGCKVSFWNAEPEAEMQRKQAICFQGLDFDMRWEFRIWEELPILESCIGIRRKTANVVSAEEKALVDAREDRDDIEGVGCCSRHITLTAVQFYDRTDMTDHLVEERQFPLYQGGVARCDGHLFILRDDVSGEECILVKNAPCENAHFHKNSSDFRQNFMGSMHICGGGVLPSEWPEEEYLYTYPVAVGVCEKDGGKELFRQYYGKDCHSTDQPYIMSNTWGDRNCDKCVCEEFILREIRLAAELGCDIVQIDDGWQQGITANSLLASGGAWSGKFRLADPDFWQVSRVKFPNGFKAIAKAARECRVELGLWFSPDSEQDYADWELDAEVMTGFYRQYGIRHFKIDGVVIRNHICVKNLIKMFEKTQSACDGRIVFNMDITSGKRFGYLFHREIGDIFVENRYSDWGNYYPHNTLRNLWELSHYFPANRLQMEVLNHKRNPEKYQDILAPAGYTIDYLFASVMAAKPLLWMEMTGLDAESRESLSKLVAVYQKYRHDFINVTPVLEKPSGFALTGFVIEGRKEKYVILLRELSEKQEFPYTVKEILATNDSTAQAAPVTLTKERSYLFGILV